VLAKKRGIFF